MNFKDEENRMPIAAPKSHGSRQKAEQSHDQRMSICAEDSHDQRKSHATQLENRPCNVHPFMHGEK